MPRAKSSSTTKITTKSSRKSKLNSPTPGRPKPMAPKAGVTVERRRYDKGGRWCW